MNVYKDIARRPYGAHLLMLALMGRTADHLALVHGVAPDLTGSDAAKRENARLHLEQHRR